MTSRFLICLALLLMCHDARADEPKSQTATTDPIAQHSESTEEHVPSFDPTLEHAQRYLVTVAEFEVAGLVEGPQTIHQMPDLLFQKIKEDDLKPLEVVRLSALSNIASHVQQTKRIRRTVATTSSGQGRGPQQVQHQSDMDIGSTLEIKITVGEQRSIAEVRFETARLVEDDDATNAFLRSTNLETTVAFEDGQPILLGSASEDTSHFFVLMIRAM